MILIPDFLSIPRALKNDSPGNIVPGNRLWWPFPGGVPDQIHIGPPGNFGE